MKQKKELEMEGIENSSLFTACSNPYDSVGIKHNFILSNSEWDTTTSINTLINTINTFSGQSILNATFLADCGYNTFTENVTIDSTVIMSLDIENSSKKYL